MSRKPSFKFPSISYDLLSQLIQSFSSEDLSNCSVKRNDSQLILKIDLHPDRSEEIVERFTFNSYKQEFAKNFESALKAQHEEKDYISEEFEDFNQFADSFKEKLLIFKTNSILADFVKRVKIQDYEDLLEHSCKQVCIKKINRSIDLPEYLIIKRLLLGQNKSFRCEHSLLIYSSTLKSLYLTCLKPYRSYLKPLKVQIENNHIFSLDPLILPFAEKQIHTISSKKQQILIQSLEFEIAALGLEGGIKTMKHEPKYLRLTDFPNEETINKIKGLIKAKTTEKELYYFQLSLEINMDKAFELKSESLRICQENNLKIFMSVEKADFCYNLSLVTLGMIGRKKDLFCFLKTKPKKLFISNKLFLFCERTPIVEKILAKLIHQKTINKVDVQEIDSFFIDLSDCISENRFVCVKNLVKPQKDQGNTSKHSVIPKNEVNNIEHTPKKVEKEKFSTNFSKTAEKYDKRDEKNVNTDRGYDSEKKEGFNDIFFSNCVTSSTTTEEEKEDRKKTKNYDTSYQSPNENVISRGGNAKTKNIFAEKDIYVTPKPLRKVDISKRIMLRGDDDKLVKVYETDHIKILTKTSYEASIN